MPKAAAPVPQDNSAEAAIWLHEDRVSETVQAALDEMGKKRWVLHYAKDYLLGVLQLLESRNLLRNLAQEKEIEKHHQETLTALRLQRSAVLRLARIAANTLPESFGAEVARVAEARTKEELDSGGLTNLTVAGWLHGGESKDAVALARVRKLVRESYKRQTLRRADLLEALGEGDER